MTVVGKTDWSRTFQRVSVSKTTSFGATDPPTRSTQPVKDFFTLTPTKVVVVSVAAIILSQAVTTAPKLKKELDR
jgi:hypothetical protein